MWGPSHKMMEPFLWGKLTPQDTIKGFNLEIGGALDEMVKKWGREKFIFHAIIPALYPFW